MSCIARIRGRYGQLGLVHSSACDGLSRQLQLQPPSGGARDIMPGSKEDGDDAGLGGARALGDARIAGRENADVGSGADWDWSSWGGRSEEAGSYSGGTTRRPHTPIELLLLAGC